MIWLKTFYKMFIDSSKRFLRDLWYGDVVDFFFFYNMNWIEYFWVLRLEAGILNHVKFINNRTRVNAMLRILAFSSTYILYIRGRRNQYKYFMYINMKMSSNDLSMMTGWLCYMIINYFSWGVGKGGTQQAHCLITLVLYLLRLRCIKIITKVLVFAALVQIDISFIA